jgi:hypothetical protein
MRKPVAILAALTLVGCASKSTEIAPAYVSPLQYQSYTCQQLAAEAQRISTQAATAAGVQDSQVTKDAVATAVAVIVAWPAAFLVQGDKGNAAQIAQMKGEMNAIEQASIQKNCGIQFRQAPPASAAAPATATPPASSYVDQK